MKKGICLLLAAMTLMLCSCSGNKNNSTTAANETTATTAAAATIKQNFEVTDKIEIDIKDYGVIKAELYGKEAPITVANFKKLIGEKFYDGLTFHRIIDGFMMQGGNPASSGSNKTANSIKGEFSANGVTNNILHLAGVLSMARTDEPDSASGQFFIMHKAASHLDGNYAAFGKVTSGMDIVNKICTETPVADQNGSVMLQNQPVINSIRLV